MAIEQSVLINKAYSYNQYQDRIIKLQAYARLSLRKSAFLCHSHKDQDIVRGLVVLFQEAGVELYIDWLDNTMPDKPNKTTAKKIQGKIKETDIFLFLATSNSKASRWCPWEIGYADASSKGIYIIPTQDSYGTVYGNEYLELYSRIDAGYNSETNKSGYAVYEPQATSGSWITESVLT